MQVLRFMFLRYLRRRFAVPITAGEWISCKLSAPCGTAAAVRCALYAHPVSIPVKAVVALHAGSARMRSFTSRKLPAYSPTGCLSDLTMCCNTFSAFQYNHRMPRRACMLDTSSSAGIHQGH